MATTTNYSWSTPDDTALVKDGAAAIRSLGTSIDTTTKALNPSTTLGDIEYRSSSANTNTRLPIGTTGQVLAVVGGVPAWATTADQTPLTTKGDIFTFDTADARLGVGANGTVLTADSAEATGLKWATPASGLTFVGARVTNATQQTIATATNSILTYTQETYDTDGFHDNSTNTSRFTIPAGKAGKYMINYIGLWSSANNTLARNVSLLKNGSNILLKTFGLDTRDDLGMSLTSVQDASVGDYFEIQVYQSSGINIDINKSSAYAEFSISYLGA
jgi:hypothetical protein